MANTLRVPRGRTPARSSARPLGQNGAPTMPVTPRRQIAATTRSRSAAPTRRMQQKSSSQDIASRKSPGSLHPGALLKSPASLESNQVKSIAKKTRTLFNPNGLQRMKPSIHPMKSVHNSYSPNESKQYDHKDSSRSRASTASTASPHSMSSGSTKRSLQSPQTGIRNKRRGLGNATGVTIKQEHIAPSDANDSSRSILAKLLDTFDVNDCLVDDYDIQDANFTKPRDVFGAYFNAYPEDDVPTTYDQILLDIANHKDYKPADLRMILSKETAYGVRLPRDRASLCSIFVETFVDHLNLGVDLPISVKVPNRQGVNGNTE